LLCLSPPNEKFKKLPLNSDWTFTEQASCGVLKVLDFLVSIFQVWIRSG